MRKVKFQVQMTLDGFIAGPEGQLDWIWQGEKDESQNKDIMDLANSCDTILMGRKMSVEFIKYWEGVVDNQPDSPEQPMARRMVDMQKIIFSHSQKDIKGRNAKMENGDLATAIRKLKEQPGKDIIVYGGAGFANSLIRLNLIDEYYIFSHPIAIGKGLSIFDERKTLKLEKSTPYKGGKTLNKFVPA